MVSTRPLTSKSSSPSSYPLVTIPNAPITIGIIATGMFHSFFFNSLARLRYLSFFSHSFNFILWSVGTAKSIILEILFFFCWLLFGLIFIIIIIIIIIIIVAVYFFFYFFSDISTPPLYNFFDVLFIQAFLRFLLLFLLFLVLFFFFISAIISAKELVVGSYIDLCCSQQLLYLFYSPRRPLFLR